MSTRVFIGIDNGPSGSVGVITLTETEEITSFFPMPTRTEQNYTKKKGNVSRIHFAELKHKIKRTVRTRSPNSGISVHVMLERPMVNPTRFRATASALRALEAVLCVMETLEMPYSYIDSKEWQRNLLPKGVTGSTELKKASKQIGRRLFPQHKDAIEKQGDADGILLAEYCRRFYG